MQFRYFMNEQLMKNFVLNFEDLDIWPRNYNIYYTDIS